MDLHKLFYLKIDAKLAGRYRKIGIVVTGSTLVFPRPAELKKDADEGGEEEGDEDGGGGEA